MYEIGTDRIKTTAIGHREHGDRDNTFKNKIAVYLDNQGVTDQTYNVYREDWVRKEELEKVVVTEIR